MPEKPEFKPVKEVKGRPVKATAFQRLFAMESVWTLGFLVFAVILAAGLAFQAFPDWTFSLTFSFAKLKP